MLPVILIVVGLVGLFVIFVMGGATSKRRTRRKFAVSLALVTLFWILPCIGWAIADSNQARTEQSASFTAALTSHGFSDAQINFQYVKDGPDLVTYTARRNGGNVSGHLERINDTTYVASIVPS